MTRSSVRIGGYSAMWGDVPLPQYQLINSGNVDYLIGDYLAEVTMAILSRQRRKDPRAGFARAIVDMVSTHIKALKKKNIKVVVNAGGMNPMGCLDALKKVAEKANIPLKIAAVYGDDLTDSVDALRKANTREMYSGEEMPDKEFASANAYFGAIPIAAALKEGVDIVVTGRVVDSALVLGIMMHEFGWKADEYDKLCMGTAAGHLIECSAQSTGGLFTDYEAEKWDNIGYPIVEAYPDGSFLLTKPPNTDGIVSFGSVAEQLCYEIQDPGAYHVPDVACDFTKIKIEEIGKDTVRVTGGRGLPPTDMYKVCATVPDDFVGISLMLVVGHNAADKARRSFETILGRTRKMLNMMNMDDFLETRIECLGANHFNPNGDESTATEVVGKIALKHKDRKAIGIFKRESVCCGVSMAQGTTGFGGTGVDGKISEVMKVFSMLVPKSGLTCKVRVDDKHFDVPVPTQGGFPGSPSPGVAAVPAEMPAGPTERVPLRSLCYARSGDKGDKANVAVIARKPEYLPFMRHHLTVERVKEYFSGRCKGAVERFDMPGINAMNFLLHEALGGGGMSSLHSDPLAKSFGQVLLLMPVDVPVAWGLGTRSKL
mmetsp:Transcript_112322/g.194772  ORF Transcript_112322/g.194772 Transcript_112322/m.194772 type:complete len:600 (+) Transcript_112322:85-1884(+)